MYSLTFPPLDLASCFFNNLSRVCFYKSRSRKCQFLHWNNACSFYELYIHNFFLKFEARISIHSSIWYQLYNFIEKFTLSFSRFSCACSRRFFALCCRFFSCSSVISVFLYPDGNSNNASSFMPCSNALYSSVITLYFTAGCHSTAHISSRRERDKISHVTKCLFTSRIGKWT